MRNLGAQTGHICNQVPLSFWEQMGNTTNLEEPVAADVRVYDLANLQRFTGTFDVAVNVSDDANHMFKTKEFPCGEASGCEY